MAKNRPASTGNPLESGRRSPDIPQIGRAWFLQRFAEGKLEIDSMINSLSARFPGNDEARELKKMVRDFYEVIQEIRTKIQRLAPERVLFQSQINVERGLCDVIEKLALKAKQTIPRERFKIVQQAVMSCLRETQDIVRQLPASPSAENTGATEAVTVADGAEARPETASAELTFGDILMLHADESEEAQREFLSEKFTNFTNEKFWEFLVRIGGEPLKFAQKISLEQVEQLCELYGALNTHVASLCKGVSPLTREGMQDALRTGCTLAALKTKHQSKLPSEVLEEFENTVLTPLASHFETAADDEAFIDILVRQNIHGGYGLRDDIYTAVIPRKVELGGAYPTQENERETVLRALPTRRRDWKKYRRNATFCEKNAMTINQRIHGGFELRDSAFIINMISKFLKDDSPDEESAPSEEAAQASVELTGTTPSPVESTVGVAHHTTEVPTEDAAPIAPDVPVAETPVVTLSAPTLPEFHPDEIAIVRSQVQRRGTDNLTGPVREEIKALVIERLHRGHNPYKLPHWHRLINKVVEELQAEAKTRSTQVEPDNVVDVPVDDHRASREEQETVRTIIRRWGAQNPNLSRMLQRIFNTKRIPRRLPPRTEEFVQTLIESMAVTVQIPPQHVDTTPTEAPVVSATAASEQSSVAPSAATTAPEQPQKIPLTPEESWQKAILILADENTMECIFEEEDPKQRDDAIAAVIGYVKDNCGIGAHMTDNAIGQLVYMMMEYAQLASHTKRSLEKERPVGWLYGVIRNNVYYGQMPPRPDELKHLLEKAIDFMHRIGGLPLPAMYVKGRGHHPPSAQKTQHSVDSSIVVVAPTETAVMEPAPPEPPAVAHAPETVVVPPPAAEPPVVIVPAPEAPVAAPSVLPAVAAQSESVAAIEGDLGIVLRARAALLREWSAVQATMDVAGENLDRIDASLQALEADVASFEDRFGNLFIRIFSRTTASVVTTCRMDVLPEGIRVPQVDDDLKNRIGEILEAVKEFRTVCAELPAMRTRMDTMLKEVRDCRASANRVFEYQRNVSATPFSVPWSELLPQDQRAKLADIPALQTRITSVERDCKNFDQSTVQTVEETAGNATIANLDAAGLEELLQRAFEKLSPTPRPSNGGPSNNGNGNVSTKHLEQLELSPLQASLMQILTAWMTERRPHKSTWGQSINTLRRYWQTTFGTEAPTFDEVQTALMDERLNDDRTDTPLETRPHRSKIDAMRTSGKCLVSWTNGEFIMHMPTLVGYTYAEQHGIALQSDELERLRKKRAEEKEARKAKGKKGK